MRTAEQWWAETKADEGALRAWLIKQHRGEASAAARIRKFRDEYAPAGEPRAVLSLIADQEERHARWVLDLLKARGIDPDVDGAEERYWSQTLPAIESFETGAAVGAHAEAMRLRRIRAIVFDASAPADVREVFAKILPEEEFHERALRRLAGDVAMSQTAGAHARGEQLLGLVA